MFTLRGWLQGCIAGAVFGFMYNTLYLHNSITVAILNTFLIALEANLLLLIFFKLFELFES